MSTLEIFKKKKKINNSCFFFSKSFVFCCLILNAFPLYNYHYSSRILGILCLDCITCLINLFKQYYFKILKMELFCYYGKCVGGVMDIVLWMRNQSADSTYIHLCANNLREGRNPSSLPKCRLNSRTCI